MYGMHDPNVAWWDMELSDPEIGRSVIETCQDIERRQKSIHDGNRRHARLYAGYLPSGLAVGTNPLANMRAPFEATKSLVRSVCETAQSLIVRSRPKSTILTTGADWDVQLQAEDLDQFLVGAYISGGLYKTSPRSFLDSTVFGTGGWKYVTRGEGDKFRVYYERVLIDDVVVDEEECREHMDPPNIYFVTTVRTAALLKKYASGNDAKSKELRYKLDASTQSPDWPTRHVGKGRCLLVEAFHVDQDDPSKNRRVLTCNNVVLESQVWPFPWHPFTFLWWCLPLTGFYGDGIAYRQYGRQTRITYMHRWIQRVYDLFATPTAWIDPVGGPPTLQMSNELGKIVSARRKPEFQTQQLITPEVYEWLNKLEADGYEDEGISQVTAANVLPPGLESAPAQREYSFKEGQRFAPVSQRWEDAIAVETAIKTTALYKHHAENTSDGTRARLQWADRKLIQQMTWPDLDSDQYEIRADASSLDSLSPSARKQTAIELAQTGWITPAQGRDLVDLPDLRAEAELDNAPIDYAKHVARDLKHGIVVPVDDKADLVILGDVIRKTRLACINRKAPPKIIANFDRFLESLDVVQRTAEDAALNRQMMIQAQMQGAAPSGQPVAALSPESAGGSPSPFPGS